MIQNLAGQASPFKSYRWEEGTSCIISSFSITNCISYHAVRPRWKIYQFHYARFILKRCYSCEKFLYKTAVTMLWERQSSKWLACGCLVAWNIILGKFQIKFPRSLPKTQSPRICSYSGGHSLIQVTALTFLPRAVQQLKLLPRVDTKSGFDTLQ